MGESVVGMNDATILLLGDCVLLQLLLLPNPLPLSLSLRLLLGSGSLTPPAPPTIAAAAAVVANASFVSPLCIRMHPPLPPPPPPPPLDRRPISSLRSRTWRGESYDTTTK